MQSWPNLSRAPIVEGLVDVRVEQQPDETIQTIKACADELAAEFPSKEELHTFTSQLNLSPEGPSISTQSQSPLGLVLRSADGKWVVQFRLDGFTLSRLEPYNSWEELQSRAKELWGIYRNATKPQRIVRVATRFINRIPLPAGESFEKTFATTFAIAASLPQAVAGFLLRVIVPFEAEAALAIVTQSLPENSWDCTFDIDAFAVFREGASESEAWSKLEQLRNIKNRLFFESLMPETLEKFK